MALLTGLIVLLSMPWRRRFAGGFLQIRISKTMLTMLTLRMKRVKTGLFGTKISKVSRVSIVFEILFCMQDGGGWGQKLPLDGCSRLCGGMEQGVWRDVASCVGRYSRLCGDLSRVGKPHTLGCIGNKIRIFRR